MEKIIYVKLLDEGVNVYRPVSAKEISRNIYKLSGMDQYDSSDERWEFPSESCVEVSEQHLSDGEALIAIKLVPINL